MIDYTNFYQTVQDSALEPWLTTLGADVDQALFQANNGNLLRWRQALDQLPELTPSSYDFRSSTITIGRSQDCDELTQSLLKTWLLALQPWRKGPYSLFGVDIDCEWRSDWKWNRLYPHIEPVKDRLVLDVGCGNGYHCWRMLGEQAKLVVGIDPSLLFVCQFFALSRYLPHFPLTVLPLTMEAMPNTLTVFDTVFSMGVLYHRRSPIDHLLSLKQCLRPGGQLVLETLVIDGGEGHVLVPEGRYAKMRNVWFIPTCLTLEAWLKRCGFANVRCIDMNKTSLEEQRATPWMTFESLADFLNPDDVSLTIEGLPAPQRAIFVAETHT